MLREQTGCDDPNAATTSGLVGYLDDEPVGWVAVEPRTAYFKLRTSRVPWTGRDEDKDDDGIWAVTCFVVRKGYRGRGLTYPLARATVDFARERGARALEAYPMITHPGKEITWGEVHVGARQVLEEAGFVEVSRPTVRRVVMRIDFERVDDVRRRPCCRISSACDLGGRDGGDGYCPRRGMPGASPNAAAPRPQAAGISTPPRASRHHRGHLDRTLRASATPRAPWQHRGHLDRTLRALRQHRGHRVSPAMSMGPL